MEAPNPEKSICLAAYRVLPREERSVETPYGAVRVKVAYAPDGTVNVAPEIDDCRRVAGERGVALKLVHQAAVAAALPRR